MRKFDLKKSVRSKGGLVHAGIYRVPQDMAQDVAERAAKDGMGEWMAEERPMPKARQTLSIGSRKTPAPENKVLAKSPEDKETKPFRPAED